MGARGVFTGQPTPDVKIAVISDAPELVLVDEVLHTSYDVVKKVAGELDQIETLNQSIINMDEHIPNIHKMSINGVKGISGNGFIIDNPTISLDLSTVDKHSGTIDLYKDLVVFHDESTGEPHTVPVNDLKTAIVAGVINILGVPASYQDMGSFTGSVIPNSSSVKTALQVLETYAETGFANVAIQIEDALGGLTTIFDGNLNDLKTTVDGLALTTVGIQEDIVDIKAELATFDEVTEAISVDLSELVLSTITLKNNFTTSASDITAIKVSVEGKASSSAVSALEVGITDINGELTAQALLIDAVTVELDGKASAEAVDLLLVQITETEGMLDAQASAITALEVEVDGKATASAVDTLTVRVTETEDAIDSQATALTSLTSVVAGKASSSALSTLDTRVTVTENSITSQSSAITSLTAEIKDKASATALSSLTTNVTAIDNEVSAIATALTEISAGTTPGDIASAKVRMTAVSAPSGWSARYAIQVKGGSGDTFQSAGLFMDVISGGASRIVLRADKLIITDGTINKAPFFILDGVVHLSDVNIENAQIGDLVVGSINIADGAITDGKTDKVVLIAPTGLTLTQDEIDADVTGEIDISILADWTDMGALYKTYEVALFRSNTAGGTYTSIDSKGGKNSRSRFRGKTTKFYKAKVRGFSHSGTPGEWSGFSNVISPSKKTAKPSTATGLTALAKVKGILLKWTRCIDPDYKETIILRNGVEIARITSNRYKDDDDLVIGTGYSYTIIHVSKSDVNGDPSAAATATYTGMAASDITFGVGKNLVMNSDARLGLAHWHKPYDANGDTTLVIRNDGIWNLSTGPVFEMGKLTAGTGAANATPCDEYGNIDFYDVVPGQRYEASVYAGAHRCSATIYLNFRNAAGVMLTPTGAEAPTGYWHSSGAFGVGYSGGLSLAGYQRGGLFAVAPPGAIMAQFDIQKSGTDAGQTSSFLFFTKAMFAEATANQTTFSPWNYTGGGMTTKHSIVNGAVTDAKTDDTAPGVVAAPGLSLRQRKDSGGELKTQIIAAWTAPATTVPIKWYEVQIYDGTDFDYRTTKNLSVRFEGIVGYNYVVSVQAISKFGAGSGFVNFNNITPGTISRTLPAAAFVTVNRKFKRNRVKWVVPSDKDYAYSELTDFYDTSNVLCRGAVSFYIDEGPEHSRYKLRNFDKQGNYTDWIASNPISEIPGDIVIGSDDLSDLAVTTAKIGSGQVTAAKIAPNAVGRSELQAGVGGATAITNSANNNSGIVNAGSGSSTLLTLTYRATSTYTATSVRLGSKTWDSVAHVTNGVYTFTTREGSGGNFDFLKSNGAVTEGQLTAVTLY